MLQIYSVKRVSGFYISVYWYKLKYNFRSNLLLNSTMPQPKIVPWGGGCRSVYLHVSELFMLRKWRRDADGITQFSSYSLLCVLYHGNQRGGRGSVSYTHLDVYKRQIIARLIVQDQIDCTNSQLLVCLFTFIATAIYYLFRENRQSRFREKKGHTFIN